MATSELLASQVMEFSLRMDIAQSRFAPSIRLTIRRLMFYEQNNIAAFKKIFIDQFLFAVKTYF
jgi:hypothetical protein